MMQTRWKYFEVQFYDHTGVAQRLERLALEGWKLEATGTFGFWKFRRIEPQALHYTVTYFADASEFDPEPGERQAAFMDLCAQSGWEYIDHQAQMLIFCSAEENPVPIETDAAMQVETIHKAVKKNFLPAQIGLLLLAVAELYMQWSMYHQNPLNVLSSNTAMLIAFCYLLIFLMCTVDISTYYLWRRKALAAAQDGEFVITKGHRGFHTICLAAILVVFAAWMISLRGSSLMRYSVLGTFAVIMTVILVTSGAKLLMKKLKISRGVNRWVTFALIFLGCIIGIALMTAKVMSMNLDGAFEDKVPVGAYEFVGETQYVYADPIPLTLESLGYVIDYPNQSQVEELNSSLLLTVYDGSDISPWGQSWSLDLYYTLYLPRFASMMETVVEGTVADRYGLHDGCREINSVPWQAERVYEYTYDSQPNGHYVVVWPDRVLEISYPEVPTETQIAATVAALKNFKM